MKKLGILGLGLSMIAGGVNAQDSDLIGSVPYNQQLNTITTAVPFLLIAPDSRAGGLGDAGLALSPDANSIHWNGAKMAFAQDLTGNDMEVSVAYSPWLRQLVNDIGLAYLGGYKQIDDKLAIGGSLRYFSLGSIQFTDNTGGDLGTYKPNEFALDFGGAYKLSDNFSVGMTARFINSNLTNISTGGGTDAKPGRAGAADLSAFYNSNEFSLGGKDAQIAAGINISNIGSKISYTSASTDRDFIPANLRVGQALTMDFDEYNSLTFITDFSKLLVPTQPIYRVDGSGQPVQDSEGNYIVSSGKDPNVGVATAIFNSFVDAPGFAIPNGSGGAEIDANGDVQIEKGSKFKEELREVNISTGFEYWYAKQFAVRAGYFYEHATKGNRQFATLGLGIKYSVFALDLSYLIPTTQRNPLQNTLRFTLRFNFGGSKDTTEEA